MLSVLNVVHKLIKIGAYLALKEVTPVTHHVFKHLVWKPVTILFNVILILLQSIFSALRYIFGGGDILFPQPISSE